MTLRLLLMSSQVVIAISCSVGRRTLGPAYPWRATEVLLDFAPKSSQILYQHSHQISVSVQRRLRTVYVAPVTHAAIRKYQSHSSRVTGRKHVVAFERPRVKEVIPPPEARPSARVSVARREGFW